MKTRLGFVSNSSSSSFICEVCRACQSGWDALLSDVNMTECENGHLYCIDHQIRNSQIDAQVIKRLKAEGITDENTIQDKMNDIYASPIEYCPICRLSTITDLDKLLYLKIKYGETNKMIEDEIRNHFKTYKDFSTFLQQEV